MKQKLIFTNLVGQALDDLIDGLDAPQVVIVADINTAQFVLPILRNDSRYAATAQVITIKSGDANKNLESLTSLWKQLSDMQATRSTVVVNLGGGMVSDLGGFAAATYQRGMHCINIPTTVLAAVDASVGGKTGINFNGYKNQLGTFTEPEAAIISTIFFNTLPRQQVLSGYAEIIKHALLEDDGTLQKVLAYSPEYPMPDTTPYHRGKRRCQDSNCRDRPHRKRHPQGSQLRSHRRPRLRKPRYQALGADCPRLRYRLGNDCVADTVAHGA